MAHLAPVKRKPSHGRVRIGTSGWHYESWRGPFFPAGLGLKQQLQYYASQFDTAELNGVFYRTPTPEAIRRWYAETGNDFIFAWKAAKFITHWKRLSENAVNSLALLEDGSRRAIDGSCRHGGKPAYDADGADVDHRADRSQL